MTDNRVVILSKLKIGDVLKVCTKNTVYRCVITGPNGEATITSTGKNKRAFYKGIILGNRDSTNRVNIGYLRPGLRMHFLYLSGSENRVTTTSLVSRIVINGGPLVLVDFGVKPRLVVVWPPL